VLLSDKTDYQSAPENMYSQLLRGFFTIPAWLLKVAFVCPEFEDACVAVLHLGHRVGLLTSNRLTLHAIAYEEVARRKVDNDVKVDIASFLIDAEVLIATFGKYNFRQTSRSMRTTWRR